MLHGDGKVTVMDRTTLFSADEDIAIVDHEVTDPTALHVHEFYEIVFVESGKLLHRYGPETHTVRAGDLFIVNPTVPHGYDLTPSGPAFIWNVILTENALNMLSLEAGTSFMIGELVGHDRYALGYRLMRLTGDTREQVVSIIKRMDEEYKAKAEGYRVVLKGFLIALVGFIYRTLKQTATTNPPLSSPQNKLGELTRYIMDHLDEPLTVESLAARYGWTPDHLSRLLKKSTGDTVQAYIGRLRSARAARMLVTDNLTVDDIAQRVGYGDARALRRAFKRYHGMSPNEFRRASAADMGS